MGNEPIKEILTQYLAANHMPDMLLVGSHGTSKRTLARLFIKSYLGDDYERGCLSIDGAVCRGKDVIATAPQKKADKPSYNGPSVLEFARTQISMGGKVKVIVIYNFEDMTTEAQNALRRIMETQAATTRFVLICNNLECIIEAIQSRCVPLHTSLLTPIEARTLIDQLVARVGADPLPYDISNIIQMLSDGDIKKIINYVQTVVAVPGINIDRFHQIFNVPPIKLLEGTLKDTLNRETHERALERVSFLLTQGYNYGDTLEMLSKILAYGDVIPEHYRMLFLEVLARQYQETSLGTANVHLYALFSKFCCIACPRQ